MMLASVFRPSDTVAILGEHPEAIQAMLDYEFLCDKQKTSLQLIINPQTANYKESVYFWGNKEIKIPIFQDIFTAAKCYTFTILVNFASARSAFNTTEAALSIPFLEKIILIAENLPEREARLLKVLSQKMNKIIIGPATVGCLIAGNLKLGFAGGATKNVIDYDLTRRGSVGIVSKSGGMLNELITLVDRCTDGVCEAIAIGGDHFPLTNLAEQALRFEKNLDIKLIILLGEVGGDQEIQVSRLLKEKKITKPLLAWVSGKGADFIGGKIQFGHAGAMAGFEQESSVYKMKKLIEAGAKVPHSYDGLEDLIIKEATRIKIVNKKKIRSHSNIAQDFEFLLKNGQVRYKKQIVSSITPRKGEDVSYGGQAIDRVSKEKSLGYVLGLLWFKKEFSHEIGEFFELVLRFVADHGPAVAGAHNTIVTARAGKDLVSSLVSGLLTIGPRFGGAVNEAAIYFKDAHDNNVLPYDFIAAMKNDGKLIPGIGHRVKSKTNPDVRVQVIIENSKKLTKNNAYLDYALAVEKVTTLKKDSLILNIDGALAAILLDILSDYCSDEEIKEYLSMEALNAFFVLGRSIGLIGHFIDQKRLNQSLYRHSAWDILDI